MQLKRVIVCLGVQNGSVIVRNAAGDAHIVGDPVELAARYEKQGADEILLRDDSAQGQTTSAMYDVVQHVAASITIPLSVRGRSGELTDIDRTLQAGARTVVVDTAAVLRPDLIGEAVKRFGSERIVAGIEARVERRQIEIMARPDNAPADLPGAASPANWFRIFTHRGATATQLDAVLWSKQCAEMGAGQLFVLSIDQQGTSDGYDLELTARCVEAVRIPVLAAGGAGSPEHVRDAFLLAGAAGAVADAGMFRNDATSVGTVKRLLHESGIPVRLPQQPGLFQ
jgi:cyclase